MLKLLLQFLLFLIFLEIPLHAFCKLIIRQDSPRSRCHSFARHNSYSVSFLCTCDSCEFWCVVRWVIRGWNRVQAMKPWADMRDIS